MRVLIRSGVVVSLLAILLLVGCSGADSDTADSDADDTQTTEEIAETSDEAEDQADSEESDAADADSGEASAFIGSWENPEGSVFRTITFHDDGTADTVNYADLEASGVWSLDGDYLKVEAADETWGSPIEWISESEFAWAYESGTWTLVE